MFMLGYKPKEHKEARALIEKNISAFQAAAGKKGH